ncbi:SGNH/GDSL hydrolase family protein [Hahella sp. NBU794]|uniref:SGNH/GDSL hydrolase family protein n=1 Tax=Hahella sp. NBU794 TaxID=3422590 RepID=UPI003D6F5B76
MNALQLIVRLLLATGIFLTTSVAAIDKPVLLIGASYASGDTPLNSDLQGPLSGISVGSGDYVDLGNALMRYGVKVKSEAQAGATTFSRISCNPECGSARWDSYETQLKKALMRVAQYDPSGFAGYNADYVIISIGNDCLHSDSFGIEQSKTVLCSNAEMNAAVDRLIAIGQQVLDLGLTPVYPLYPNPDDLDLSLFANLSGLTWAMSNDDFKFFGRLYAHRIHDELDGALLVNPWRTFEHRGDGIHPNEETVMKGARRILWAIQEYEASRQ